MYPFRKRDEVVEDESRIMQNYSLFGELLTQTSYV